MNEYEKVTKCVKMSMIEGLKERLPQIFEDSKVNLDKLKALLVGEVIEKDDDRFYFNWAGKSDLFRLIQAPAYGTLKPNKERSVDFDNTENIVIVGENLETLKLLLKPYFGKVKIIYIDPPYNTGKDFIYRDNFKEPLRDYLEKTGQIDSEGSKLTTNTETSGRYHSDWLNFMYPRLFLARSLLRDDGAIFISIDDHEVYNLRKIMDEIFGEENFISNFIWKKKAGGGSDTKYVAVDHEYVLTYTRNERQLPRFFIKMSDRLKKEYKLKDQYFDERGPYKRKNLHQTGIETDRPNLKYPIQAPDGTMIYPPTIWRWSRERFEEAKSDGRIDFVKDSNGIWKVYTKMYLYEGGERKVKPRSILDNVGFTRDGNKDIEELFNERVYDYPKPVSLLKYLISIITRPKNEDIILDFFAGSGTTGHAVWELNKEDGGNRKFILVNLDEEVQDENIKKRFPTIADICIERLRRASEKYNIGEQSRIIKSDQDFGFKVFQLDKSNFNLKDDFEISEEENIEELKEKYLEYISFWINKPIVEDWKAIDIVYEVVLKEGMDLNSKIGGIKIEDNDFFYVIDDKQQLIFYICLDEKITEETIEKIRTPEYRDKRFVFLDKALKDNDKLNLGAFVNLKVI